VRVALAERARERGIEVSVLGPDADLAALVAEAVAGGADALGVAGGDGSLAVVAAAAQEHGLAFVCIPAGTRNHFALDLGVDRRDLVGALDAFTDGVERRIDVAQVNGRVFLNNVSLGIYGDAVQRPGYRDAKVPTLLQTAQAVLGPSGTAPDLHLVDDRGREYRHPAVVLVSNNPYALDRPLVAGTRTTLAGGRLGVLVLDRPGDPRRAPGRAWTSTAVRINASVRVHAGLDGEAVDLQPPLEIAIRPAALVVRISSRHPGVSPSGRLTRRGAIAADPSATGSPPQGCPRSPLAGEVRSAGWGESRDLTLPRRCP
jgi:diacylglycerol kinase family enzyme